MQIDLLGLAFSRGFPLGGEGTLDSSGTGAVLRPDLVTHGPETLPWVALV
jgi:hypothetical protein